MKFDIQAEIAKQTAAYTNPLTVAEKVRRDYAQMPEYVEPRPKPRKLRLVSEDERLDDPRHDF